ncbi:MAG: cell division protein FtsW [Akkermansiaceae bacterium]|nr:cell division protein FtsW [Akkermansiaceae bacterium]NNM28835.1 cell division protein FtsW [Akkermansiaceae bacterium]
MARRSAIVLCVAVAALVVLGLVMLASTSVWVEDEDTRYFHVKRQVLWTGVGLLAACCMAFLDYRLLRRFWIHILVGACVLLALCYVPGVGVLRNGETRWINLPFLGQFQPSEPAKIAIMIALAAWFAQYQAEARCFWRGFVLPGLLLAIPTGLIFFEKDMGTAAAVGAAGFALMFAAGTRWWWLAVSAAAGFAGLAYMVRMDDNRWSRIMSFMDLEGTKLGFGLQQYRARLAFGSGGVTGVGLGNGAEKHGYLPFAHTDFIFAMIGEELGLVFTLGTVFAFVLICTAGLGIALHAQDHFGRVLGVGITAVIVVPAIMNIGVATATLPNTGLPLPFVSYGGSNLVFTLAAVGLLVSLHRRAVFAERAELPVIKERKLALKL